MKILIVEDEVIARQKLIGFLNEIAPDTEVLAQLESVKDTVCWLEQNEPPEVAFFDIQLSDATCFEIFDQHDVRFPVIFLTAYDDYVMKAFESNAIHYILKPTKRAKIAEALKKVNDFREHFVHIGIRNLIGNSRSIKSFPERLVVRKGLDAIPLSIVDVAYFFSEHKMSFAKTIDGITYMVDEPLSELEKMVKPEQFFRVNRQYLVNIKAVKNFRSTRSSKIQLELMPETVAFVMVSRENARHFRSWVRGD